MNRDPLQLLVEKINSLQIHYQERAALNYAKNYPKDPLSPIFTTLVGASSRKNKKLLHEQLTALPVEQWKRPFVLEVFSILLRRWFTSLPKKSAKLLPQNPPQLFLYNWIDWELGTKHQAAVLQATWLRNLSKLYFYKKLPRDIVRLLKEATHLANLESLHFDKDAKIDDEIAQVIFTSPQYANLQSFATWDQPIGDQAVMTLANAAHMSKLEVLKLSSCTISTAGCAALFAAKHLVSLKQLELQSNRDISDEGLAPLDGSTHFKNLSNLNLSYAGIGDVGAGYLSRAELPALTRLELSGNHLTDDGAANLAAAPWFGQLTTIALNNNRISESGRQKLEGALSAGSTMYFRANNPPGEPVSFKEALTILHRALKPLLLSSQLSSVSEEKFEVVQLEGIFTHLNPTIFYQAFGLDRHNPEQVIHTRLEVNSFWSKVSAWHQKCGHGHSECEEVGHVLNRLKDVMGVVLGEDSFATNPMHPVYVIGITEDQKLIGLRSEVCWA